MCSLSLAIVSKLVAVPTSKDGTAIEDGYAARTASSWAEEPSSLPSIVAPRAVQKNWILLAFPILPVPLVLVAENNAVEISNPGV